MCLLSSISQRPENVYSSVLPISNICAQKRCVWKKDHPYDSCCDALTNMWTWLRAISMGPRGGAAIETAC